MIDPKSLKIGNLVHHNSEWCYKRGDYANPNVEINEFDFQWTESDWYALGESTLFIENISPIPLSPSLLERAGFVRYGSFWINPSGDTWFKFLLEDGKLWFYLNGVSEERFIAVNPTRAFHELQNLYYSLTGQELELKP